MTPRTESALILGKVYFGRSFMVSQEPVRSLIEAQIERAHVELDCSAVENVFSLCRKSCRWRQAIRLIFGIEEGRDADVTCADTPMFTVIY